MAVEMVYRVKTAGRGRCTGQKFSGVKIGHGLSWRLEMPDFKTINIANYQWSYITAYIGLDFIWYAGGQPQLNAVEAGVSMRGTEFHDPNRRGWYPFFNYGPRKQYPPFNDPDPWRAASPITGNACTLELRVGKLEIISGSYRWRVHYYVNGEEVFVGPLYGGAGNPNPNQFDAKVCVGCYMATGNEDEISFGPCRVGYLQMGRADNPDFPLEKVWLPLKPEYMNDGEAGIERGTAINTSQNRDFVAGFEAGHYIFTVALPPRT